ncbi:MAG: hypothetical protein ABSE48_05260 [Verrucomicrobiota bacterium]|jgi:hypothetical protein
MKALIIYQDFASAAKANSALQHAAQCQDVRVQWDVRPWRMDMLQFPPTATDALEDALDAHLIVIAGGCARSCSQWLQDWLEQWATCRQIEASALAVIGAGSTDKFWPRTGANLSEFAKRHGLSVIYDDRGTIEHGPLFPVGFLLDPTLSKYPTLPQTEDRSNSDENRGWGINE